VTTERIWEVPAPLSVHEVCMDDGASILVRRHGNPNGTRLVISHGNGLAIDLYYPFWTLLADEFDLITYDLRNHGWNSLGPLRNHNLPTFAADHARVFEAIDRLYGKKPKVGVFHSISALSVVLSPDTASQYAGLFLFDPPICTRGKTYEEFEAAAQRMSRFAEVRTPWFRSRAEMAELLPYSSTFRCVVPGVYDLVAKTTLRKSSKGAGYELCCPPSYEAQIIAYAGNFAVLIDLDAVRCPVKVLGADPLCPFSYLPTFDLTYLVKVDYDFLPDATHFLQLEQPKACAAAVREFLALHNLGSS